MVRSTVHCSILAFIHLLEIITRRVFEAMMKECTCYRWLILLDLIITYNKDIFLLVYSTYLSSLVIIVELYHLISSFIFWLYYQTILFINIIILISDYDYFCIIWLVLLADFYKYWLVLLFRSITDSLKKKKIKEERKFAKQTSLLD